MSERDACPDLPMVPAGPELPAAAHAPDTAPSNPLMSSAVETPSARTDGVSTALDMSGKQSPGRRGADLTSGPITKTLILFALPTLGSNILQSLNGSINTIWVGRFLGESAVAATANANTIMFLAFAAVFGFGMAATVMIGQAMGRRDIDAARRAFGSALGFLGIIAVLTGLIGWLAAPAILTALATPAEAYALALAYLRVTFVAIPASMLSVMVMMGLRGVGDSVTPLRFMLLSVGIDILLNPVLILGLGPFPRLGIAGSALATVAAGTISLIALVAYIYWKDLPLRLRGAELAYLRPALADLGYLLRKGLPMGAQMIVIAAASLIMSGLVNLEGLNTAAAYGATMQLWAYVQMPALAVAAAVSAMAAQNIGAGQWGRVERITRSGIVVNLALTGALIALLLAFDRPVLGLFLGGDSPAVDIARHIQFIATGSFLMFGVTMVLFSTMRANGAVLAPLLILCVTLYPVRLGTYHLLYPMLGADAIWWSFPIGMAASMLLAAAAYWRGGWRDKPAAVPGGRHG